jgi:hypothetical protein
MKRGAKSLEMPEKNHVEVRGRESSSLYIERGSKSETVSRYYGRLGGSRYMD